MAGIFAILSLAMCAIYWSKRTLTIGLIFLALILTILIFWHHVTDILKINW